METMMKIGLVIPTLNAGKDFPCLLEEIRQQDLFLERMLVMDSGSTDQTTQWAEKKGFELFSINKAEFNHGTARQAAAAYLLGSVDIVIFLTQDVRLQGKLALSLLVAAFHREKVGAAYGRQLPHIGASPMAAQARLFNYPEKSCLKTYADRKLLGIKAPFMSDSFAAYRLSSLFACGGFPHAIVSEDMYVGAKLLIAGQEIAYVAEAQVFHSHDYTLLQEFRRYFDIGVFQTTESWISTSFGKAEGEGLRLVISQLRYLWKQGGILAAGKAFLVNGIRFFGYRLGSFSQHLPQRVNRLCSGQPYYFREGV